MGFAGARAPTVQPVPPKMKMSTEVPEGVATPDRLEVISNTYLAELGRGPVNLEVIAALAALKGAPATEAAIRRIVLAQIAYRGAWDSIRQEFTQGQEPGA